MNKTIIYVRTGEQLVQALKSVSTSTACAIDTEFVWERTYAPQLGLIQIAANGDCLLIDPLEISDWSPLVEILENPGIEKVFHASGMDLRVLWDTTGAATSPIFDTQVAAALLGHGNQISYSSLVEQLAGASIDKSETYTNWLHRPLSARQIEYAANDVHHLIEVYRCLKEELERRGRTSWAQQEFESIADPARYAEVDPHRIFLGIRRSGTLDQRALGVLRELAEWRDATARIRNLRPHAIIRDEAMVELARRRPSTTASLFDIRGIDQREANKYGDQIMARISTGLSISDDDLPVVPERNRTAPATQAAAELIWSLVLTRALNCDVSAELLTSKTEVKSLVEKYPPTNGDHFMVLEGWRRELLGNDIIDILEGNKVLAYDEAAGVSLISHRK